MNQLFIIAQKRTGSTLLQRIINQIPGFSISGENGGAFIHLAKFYRQLLIIPSKNITIQSFTEGETTTKPSWLNPWIHHTENIRENLRAMMEEMYAVQGSHVWGFKEIRYGRFGEPYNEFVEQISFLRDLFPTCKLLFLTRKMESLIDSNLKRPPKGIKLSDEEITRLLRLQFSHFQKYLDEYPGNTFLLSFEDILSQKPLFREKMFEFLEVPLKEDYLRPLKKNL